MFSDPLTASLGDAFDDDEDSPRPMTVPRKPTAAPSPAKRGGGGGGGGGHSSLMEAIRSAGGASSAGLRSVSRDRAGKGEEEDPAATDFLSDLTRR